MGAHDLADELRERLRRGAEIPMAESAASRTTALLMRRHKVRLVATRSGPEHPWATLGEVLSDVGNVPDELVIYVREVVKSVDCATPIEPLDEEVDDPSTWLRYLLEIPTMKEVLQVWTRWRDGRTPTEDEACEAVVHYAEHDAYLPVE